MTENEYKVTDFEETIKFPEVSGKGIYSLIMLRCQVK